MVILQVLFSGYGFYKIRTNDYNIFFFAEAELSKKNIVVREVWEELLTVSGCLLMIIPGLTSDILGILLFQHPRMNADIDNYIKLIGCGDPKLSENAYNRLWQMEENKELLPETIAKFFKYKENPVLIQYAVEALGRLKDPAMFSGAASAYTECDDLLLQQSFLENFRLTESDYFIDAVLKKIGFKKTLLGAYKKDEGRWQKMARSHRFTLVPAVKYLQTCVTQKYEEILLFLLENPDPSVRFNVLLAISEQKILIGKELIEKISRTDPHETNKRQAVFILETMYSEQGKS
ncbi:hypothetical protein CHS0354_001993 [Potamilus streckersoni]|uniref:Uncharacterized protein n=1 Tax=Potamilus streckersoni TaxID=2493646 RepID=A0AAE0W8J5_9BIVA|nr:hypothetical protein CHS0354_001993 [Potamilus streckersoni]